MLSLCLFLTAVTAVVYMSLNIVPARFLLFLSHLNLNLGFSWNPRQMACRNAVCEGVNCSDSGRASAVMGAVSRERSTPDADAFAVATTYMCATTAYLHPAHSLRTSMVIPSMSASPTRMGCIVYRLSSMPAACRWAGRFVAICGGVQASSPSPRLLEHSRTGTLGDCHSIAHCTYSAACRYLTTAAITPNSRRSSRLGGTSQRLSEQETESKPFAPLPSTPPVTQPLRVVNSCRPLRRPTLTTLIPWYIYT